MPDLAHLHDKKFAIIMVDDDGTEDGDWVVVSGIAKWRDGHLFAFRGSQTPEFPIPDDTLDRVEAVKPEVREILEGADYSVLLRVGPIPDGTDQSTLIHTGFRWPDKEKSQ
jgi:hypothetical protein